MSLPATCVDSTPISTVINLRLVRIGISYGLVLPILIFVVAALILTAAVVVLQLLSKYLVIQSRHDNCSPESEIKSYNHLIHAFMLDGITIFLYCMQEKVNLLYELM